MFLKNLSLQNFRSFTKKNFIFSDNTTLIVGPNAVGKTNILEAICLLSTGKSFRATKESEMIKDGQEICRVNTDIVSFDLFRSSRVLGTPRKSNKEQLEVTLTTGEIQGKRVAKKLFKVNGVGKYWRDFVGNLKTVLFRPEDIDIIIGSPSLRRDYLDSVLEQVDSEYRRSNLSYKKGLRQRNKLLDRIREGKAQRSQLEFWNRLLIKNGEIISRKREEFIEFCNFRFSSASWRTNFQKNFKNLVLVIEYDKSAISQARLDKYAQAEFAIGATLVGPHRDNLEFITENSEHKIERDLALYGSRGEQRMAILVLKLAELEFITAKNDQDRPLLLLDDIFSELDNEHRIQVLSIISKQQTIITTTDINLVEKGFLTKMEVVRI